MKKLLSSKKSSVLHPFLIYLKDQITQVSGTLKDYFDSPEVAKEWCIEHLLNPDKWQLIIGRDFQIGTLSGSEDLYSPKKRPKLKTEHRSRLEEILKSGISYSAILYTPENEIGSGAPHWHIDAHYDPINGTLDDPTYTTTYYKKGNTPLDAGTWYFDTPYPKDTHPKVENKQKFRSDLIFTIRELFIRFVMDNENLVQPYIQVTEPDIIYRGLVDTCVHRSPDTQTARTHLILKKTEP